VLLAEATLSEFVSIRLLNGLKVLKQAMTLKLLLLCRWDACVCFHLYKRSSKLCSERSQARA
jgi:hypothetical protein